MRAAERASKRDIHATPQGARRLAAGDMFISYFRDSYDAMPRDGTTPMSMTGARRAAQQLGHHAISPSAPAGRPLYRRLPRASALRAIGRGIARTAQIARDISPSRQLPLNATARRYFLIFYAHASDRA